MAIILREFIYYDREKIEDFLSSIEDGIVKEEIETRTEHATQLKVGGGVGSFLNASGQKGYADNELRKLKTSTDASLFQRLYTCLSEENMLKYFEDISQEDWKEIKRGDILEIEADVEFSGLSVFFEKIMKLMGFLEQLGFDQMDDKSREAMLGFQLMNQLSADESLNLKITPVKSLNYKFVATLPHENIKGNKQELIGEYKVLCRVQKIINENEKIELVKLIPGIELDEENLEGFVQNFEDMPPMLGTPPKMEDLQISYPAMIVTPIAIYR